MDLRASLKALRGGYLWRMVTPFPLYGAVTVIYFYFGQGLDSWEQLVGALLFLVFWNVVITGGLAFLLYHFHLLRKKEEGRAVPRLDQLSLGPEQAPE